MPPKKGKKVKKGDDDELWYAFIQLNFSLAQAWSHHSFNRASKEKEIPNPSLNNPENLSDDDQLPTRGKGKAKPSAFAYAALDEDLGGGDAQDDEDEDFGGLMSALKNASASKGKPAKKEKVRNI